MHIPNRYKSSIQLERFFWNSIDWLFPPDCACCQKANFVVCPACENQFPLITEHVCEICGIPVAENQFKCDDCISTPPLFSGMRSYAHYSGTVREAIHSLKYKNNIALGFYFSKYLNQILQRVSWDFDLVIPVPLSKKHMKERGFNQSALIARPLARTSARKFDPQALMRIKETRSQVNLTAAERHENVKDAFLGNPDKLKKKSILLVDDVITTGATMEYCTKALLDSGAKKVYCISIARVLHNQPC